MKFLKAGQFARLKSPIERFGTDPEYSKSLTSNETDKNLIIRLRNKDLFMDSSMSAIQELESSTDFCTDLTWSPEYV